jgi:hypothetical protein
MYKGGSMSIVSRSKKTFMLALVLCGLLVAAVDATATSVPRYDDWKTIYSYSDDYSAGFISRMAVDKTVAARSYAWSKTFSNVFIGKVTILELDEDKNHAPWTGPRMNIVNPENLLERYEVRMYPLQDTLQVNYVDRSQRTGDWTVDDELTESIVIQSTDCKVLPERTYHMVITNNKDNWRVSLMHPFQPTCFLKWTDDRIQSGVYAAGIQSAGKYLVSEFQHLASI